MTLIQQSETTDREWYGLNLNTTTGTCLKLIADTDLASHFYFSGGTALSHYYLQHRFSEDLDFFNHGAFNPLKYANVVLDEVDRMLDIGFLKDIQTLIELLPQPRSSFFFSATMNKQVETVMRSFLRDPIRVAI